MTILLLGSNGQVGHELRRALAPLGDVVCTTRNGLLSDNTGCETADFDQPQSLPPLLDRIAPRIVVNAAAYTAVDKAEDEPTTAFRINAKSPEMLARWCAAHHVPFVHYSTDYVFDGQSHTPYTINAQTAPLGVYGASKFAGEQAIRAAGGQHMILRTAWVYAAHGKNFLLTMLRAGAQHDVLRVVADQIGTPTSAALIADVTAQVLQHSSQPSGTWHLTPSGQTSWHGFAEAIFKRAAAAGLLPRIPQVLAIPSSEYPTPAKRPNCSCLDNTKLQADFGLTLPQWETGLDHVITDLTVQTHALATR